MHGNCPATNALPVPIYFLDDKRANLKKYVVVREVISTSMLFLPFFIEGSASEPHQNSYLEPEPKKMIPLRNHKYVFFG
jgi:hypothetical protein